MGELSTLHSVLDSLENTDVGRIVVSLHGYDQGCASEVLAFSTVCAMRSRCKLLSICGAELLAEAAGDDAAERELLALDAHWEHLSAEIQVFRKHEVEVVMSYNAHTSL